MVWAEVAQSVQRLATGWTVLGSSRWGRYFPFPSRPVLGPTQPLYKGYRVFPGSKAAGAWLWPPIPI